MRVGRKRSVVALAGLAFFLVLGRAIPAAAAQGAVGPEEFLNLAPAGHEAFIYFDVAKFRETSLFKGLRPNLDRPEIQAKINAFQQFTGMRLPDDLDVVAASGKIAPNNEGCLYIRGRWDRQRLETLFSMNPGYTEIPKPAGKIIGFLDENKGNMTYLCFVKNDLAVIGTKEGVESSLDVIAGEGRSMAEDPRVKVRLAKIGPHPLFAAVLVRPQVFPPDLMKVPAVQSLRSAVLTGVSSPASITLTARIETETDQVAGQLLDIVRGLIALGQVQQKVPKVSQIAYASSARKQGNEVVVTSAVNVSDALGFIRKRIAMRRAARAAVQGMRVRGGAPASETEIPPQW